MSCPGEGCRHQLMPAAGWSTRRLSHGEHGPPNCCRSSLHSQRVPELLCISTLRQPTARVQPRLPCMEADGKAWYGVIGCLRGPGRRAACAAAMTPPPPPRRRGHVRRWPGRSAAPCRGCGAPACCSWATPTPGCARLPPAWLAWPLHSLRQVPPSLPQGRPQWGARILMRSHACLFLPAHRAFQAVRCSGARGKAAELASALIPFRVLVKVA